MPYFAPAQATQTAAVIPTGNLRRWIEPWYIAYAILGVLSGAAAILIPLAIANAGGSATQIGAAIAALNVGALFARFWGWISDRSKSYRSIFFSGFLLIADGFVSFALFKSPGFWLFGAFLIGFGTGASNTVASLFDPTHQFSGNPPGRILSGSLAIAERCVQRSIGSAGRLRQGYGDRSVQRSSSNCFRGRRDYRRGCGRSLRLPERGPVRSRWHSCRLDFCISSVAS